MQVALRGNCKKPARNRGHQPCAPGWLGSDWCDPASMLQRARARCGHGRGIWRGEKLLNQGMRAALKLAPRFYHCGVQKIEPGRGVMYGCARMVTRYGVEAAHVRICYAGIAWSSKPFLKLPVPAGVLRLETRYTGLLPANGHACSPAPWRPSCTTYGDTAAPGS